MNRVVFVCHCLLDPLTRAAGTKKIDRELIKYLIDEVSVIQLPCPEMIYGFLRPPCNKEDYDTPEYRKHCRRLAEKTVETVLHYRAHEIKVVGLVSIGGSPSCGFQRTHVKGKHVKEPGIFMEELQSIFRKYAIKIEICDHELLADKGKRDWFLSLGL